MRLRVLKLLVSFLLSFVQPKLLPVVPPGCGLWRHLVWKCKWTSVLFVSGGAPSPQWEFGDDVDECRSRSNSPWAPVLSGLNFPRMFVLPFKISLIFSSVSFLSIAFKS